MKIHKHKLTQLPKEIIRQSIFVCIFSAVLTLVFDRLAFSLQWAKDYVSDGKIGIGLFFFALYFIQDTFKTSFQTLLAEISVNYEQQQGLTLISHGTDILVKLRGKVWRKTVDGKNEIISTNGILLTVKGYLSDLWSLKEGIPRGIVEVISATIMLWSFIALLGTEVEHLGVLLIAIFLSSVASIFISFFRIRFQKKARKQLKNASEGFEVALNDVFNLEPLNSHHAKYMTNKVKLFNIESFKINRHRRRTFNLADIGETFLRALSMLFIIGIKLYEIGIDSVNLDFITSVVALSAIYSQILSRLHSIIHVFENLKITYDGIQTYSDDFEAIIKAWDHEESLNSKYDNDGQLQSMTLPDFVVSYRAQGHETPFSLRNDYPLTYKQGDCVLLTGPTGCGKTTLLRLATENLRFDGVNVNFNFERPGNITSLLYQSDCKLGANNVFSELTFDRSVSSDQLIHILRGLHLYDELVLKHEDVLEYLKNSHITDFSTGQRQRFAIARLLLNVDSSTQIIAFDEATNALNDEITEQVLSFICEYCKNCIILLASHQVDIVKTFANHHLEFIPDDDGIFFKVNVIR